MNDPIIFIFIAIGSICMGFLLGFMVRGFTRRNSKPDETLETNQEQKEKTTPKKVPNRNWTEVANLWRDRRNGSFMFQIENEFYIQGSDLTTKEKGLLLKVVMDFYRWLEPPIAMPSATEETVKPAFSTENKQDELVQPELPSDSVRSVPVETESQNNQKGNLSAANVITRALRSDVKTSTVPAKSMVAQMDEILQEKLQVSDMQKWAVRLAELPGKGMVVLVGLEQYSYIDDVPYERVRKIIRESVAEWERRAENGELTQ